MATQVLALFVLDNKNNATSSASKQPAGEATASSQQQQQQSDLDAKLFLLEQFHQRELQLFKEIKEFFSKSSATTTTSCATSNSGSVDHKNALEEQLKELLRKKEETLNTLFDSRSPVKEEQQPKPVLPVASLTPTLAPILAIPATMLPPPPKPPLLTLTVVQQPTESVVSNRYLSPSPAVQVNLANSQLNNLYIVASIVHNGTDVELIKTVDGRHDVLQGNKRVSFDANGKAVFNKLKIMEVSSKHKHQAFCFVFSLEETTQQQRKVLAQVRSVPFYVQSRPNKRKLVACSAPSSPGPDQGVAQEAAMKRARSADNFQSQPLSPGSESELDEEAVTPKTGASEPGSLLVHDYNYIDITELLVLPQKDAARKLGISESMLCKRFKECTRRKWPYRYLRKIDKVINILNLHKSDGVIPKEDREKLERLTKERDECLRPVKIRITACDKLSGVTPTTTQNNPNASSSDDEDEIPDDILETLGKMKSGSPPL
eukprot:TRINITY_DN315_c0_g1_i1.p1 TRINITY_DN315_c0_g1~~TRINITY_DN315_c0_g1_i1.p1  ORF type:complete len:489 (+),score=153.06 TRINITY_DN315_c0_g1_i1:207-1673(+)